MDVSALDSGAKVAAFIAGITFGSFAISSASWVWLRKQVFGYGGSGLCAAGVVLLGLSIWHSVEVNASGTGLMLKMIQSANEAAAAAKSAALEASSAAKSAQASSDKVIADENSGKSIDLNETLASYKAAMQYVEIAKSLQDTKTLVDQVQSTASDTHQDLQHINARLQSLNQGKSGFVGDNYTVDNQTENLSQQLGISNQLLQEQLQSAQAASVASQRLQAMIDRLNAAAATPKQPAQSDPKATKPK